MPLFACGYVSLKSTTDIDFNKYAQTLKSAARGRTESKFTISKPSVEPHDQMVDGA